MNKPDVFIPTILSLLCLAGVAMAADGGDKLDLRGYGRITSGKPVEGPVTTRLLSFDDTAHAQRFVSKLYSDFELTPGNRVESCATPKGEADLIVLGDTGCLLPLVVADSADVVVLAGSDRKALVAEAARQLKAPPLRRAQMSHPRFMDKWDRHCLGFWTDILPDPQAVYPEFKDDPFKAYEAFYKWCGEKGVNPQILARRVPVDLATCDNVVTWARHYLRASGADYQRVPGWLVHHPDLYNRNPFLALTRNPHVESWTGYYGETQMAGSLLRQVQNANALTVLKPTLGDPNQMAIVDPNGETGGHLRWSRPGLYGPTARREFVRFLRDVRKLTLPQVSQRYYGRDDALKSWDDIELADWREFFGWTDGAIDLAGEWRFMRDEKADGQQQEWARPDFDDSDWVRLYYPGDAILKTFPVEGQDMWMRRTFTLDKSQVENMKSKIYLSLAPMTRSPVEVFINGLPVKPMKPGHTLHAFGQYDITELARAGGPITVAMRLKTLGKHLDAPRGPMFVTPKALEEFPTSDPLLNARRWDYMEFTDWAVAQSIGSTLEAIRSVEPDLPIKVQAYSESAWGGKTVAKYGGYSHNTGSGPVAHYDTPKRFGSARGLQDSSETGGSLPTVRDFMGLWGNLASMGKNAHDYFISPQAITGDPEKRAYFERKIADIKVMGRANAIISPVAAIRGLLNSDYEGDFAHEPNWRYAVSPMRGGELVPLLDEVRVREGNLGAFPVIMDEGTSCWDEEMAAALKTYVEQGGVLILNRVSGANTFIQRDAGPGSALAGVRLGPAQEKGNLITFAQADERLPGLKGEMKVNPRRSSGPGSVSLEPLPGTDVLGHWPDGTPAFTRRNLGKGAVYFCGGAQYPKGFDTAVAAAFGPQTYATVANEGGRKGKDADGTDRLRTARSNNGSEELLMLRGLGKPVTVTWTFEEPPVGGIFDPVTGEPVEAKIDGKTATFTVTIPDWDFRWFAARRPGSEAAFSHWLERQTEMWSGVVRDAKEPVVPLFRNLDLNRGWKLVQTDSPEKARALQALDDDAAGLKPTELVFWNAPGMDTRFGEGVVGLYRRTFDLPENWRVGNRFDLAVSGVLQGSLLHGFAGPGSISLNGQEIWSGSKLNTTWFDITKLLKPTGNRLEIIHPSPGILPMIRLVRSALPESVIDLGGEWQAVSGPNDQQTVKLPGKVPAGFVFRDVFVPESAAGKEVWLRVEGKCTSAIINGRQRYKDMWSVDRERPAYEIDITPDLRFGQVNRIALGNANGGFEKRWQPGTFECSQVGLAIYQPGQWSPDGKGTREALTAAELAAVAHDAAIVQQYPMVHPRTDKPATPKVEAESKK